MDVAGGMLDDMKKYINSQENTSSVTVKIGMGLILVKGLAQLCGTQISVSENIWDTRAVGTIYLLTFESKPR